MGLQQLLILGSVCFGLLGLGAFVLLVSLYLRKEAQQKEQYARTKRDLADTALLFQTMRDVVRQQKELAKSFNADLEAKISGVKQILSRSLEKNEKLYERQQLLMQELEEAKAQLHGLQRQLAKANVAGVRPPKPAAPRAAQELAALAANFDAPREPTAPQPAPGALQGTGITRHPHTRWNGEPLEAPLPFDAPPAPAPAPPPAAAATESPARPAPVEPAPQEDPQAARQAFRALLNLEAQETPQESAPPSAHAGNGNSGRVPPLQHRVVEYHRAGMPVADIARELGIGRGEVRLMLSLANEASGE